MNRLRARQITTRFALAFALLVAPGAALAASGATRLPGTWRRLPAAPFAIGANLASVWTGKEMLVYGVPTGQTAQAVEAYNPTTRTWRRLADPPKTESFCRLGAAWTGKEMLVWGCGQLAFNPSTNQWRRLPAAPTREGITVWTGRDLIGWGGGCCGDADSSGSAYNVARNAWRKLPRSPLAASQGPVGVWTGRELLLFVSGFNPDGKPYPARVARAAAYNPSTNRWRRIARPPETGGTAVWDGHRVLLIGGGAQGKSTVAYSTATNRWSRLAALTSSRSGGTAVWTGKRVLVWDGLTSRATTAVARLGVAYNPKTDRWSTLPPAPLSRRDGSTVVWTGRSLIVFGGVIGTPVGKSTPPKYLADAAAFTPR
jgi:hypothetical protein